MSLNKEEYLKKHKVSERKFLIYCVNALLDESIRDGDNINDLTGFLYDLIMEHFKGIKNLDEIIKMQQKINLNSNYMIGLCNGLILAKGIIENTDVDKLLIKCKENNPPLKFEELEEGVWVWDDKYKTYYVIKKIGKGKSIFARYNRFVINEFTGELEEADCGWMGSFEENRFYRKEVKE